MERWCCTNEKCECYVKCNATREIFWGGGDVRHNHDKDSEASLNRQILNNSVKRKAVEDLCQSPRKLIHKELHRQDLNTLSYQDTRNVRRHTRHACSSQLLPLPKNVAETHEALCAVQVLTSSKEQFLLLNDSEKNIVRFFCKTNLRFLSSIDCFTLMGHSDQFQSFSTNYLKFMGSKVVTMCHLHFSCWPINVKRHMRSYSDIQLQRLQNMVWMCVPQSFMLISKPLFTRQWEQCGRAVKLKHVVFIEDRAGGGKYSLWDSASSTERRTQR
jgi:hypothetical protein